MARAKYQVLILPYKKCGDEVKYCIFKRRDMEVWQFIAGGGEEEDASPLESAKREAFEEAYIEKNEKYFKLETQCSIATKYFEKARLIWGEECLVIPEYSFAVKVLSTELHIAYEHMDYEWVNYDKAIEKLKYDSNKVALWGLDNKIKLGIFR